MFHNYCGWKHASCRIDMHAHATSCLSPCEGDDEQSDWFFEGECGAGAGVTSLLSNWDSEHQLSLEDNLPSPTFLQPARPSQRGNRG